MRRWSPARSWATSSSERGGVTISLLSSRLIMLYYRLLAARAVALEVDGHMERGNVGGEGLDEDVQGGVAPSHSLGAYPQGIDLLQKLLLQGRHLGLRAALADPAGDRLLGQGHGVLGGAAHPHADDDRRAGVARRLLHRPQDEIGDALLASAGEEVGVAAHVLAAAPLGHYLDVHLVPGHPLQVDDG